MITATLKKFFGFTSDDKPDENVETIFRDTRRADLMRVYSRGIITLRPQDMTMVVGKVVGFDDKMGSDFMVINCLNSVRPADTYVCIRSPIVKYSDEAMTGLCKLTPMERKLLFSVYTAMPGRQDKTMQEQLELLRANGFFSGMGSNEKRRRSDAWE